MKTLCKYQTIEIALFLKNLQIEEATIAKKKRDKYDK